MNEIFFFLQIITVISFVLASLYLGKETLVACICIQAVLANLFVIKQITLFGLNVTSSDVFVIGSVLALNLLQEYFGKSVTKKAIWASFLMAFFYLVMSQLHLLYVPNMYDNTHNFFVGILKFMPRITIASLIAYFIVQRLDCWFYGLLKKAFESKYLITRNIVSILVTQFVDTFLFAFMGLYGIIASIWSVILISFVIKTIIILVSTPFVGLSKRVIRKNYKEV